MELASASAHVVEGAPENVCHHCLCPQGELQLLPTSLEESSRSAGRSDSGAYEITAWSWYPRVCEILCAPFKSEVSISSNSLGLSKVSPTGLQSQMLWGLIFLVQNPQAGEPDMGLSPLTPLGEPLQS